MIDFFHLASEKEDPAIVAEAGPRLRHLHTANPQGRVFPLKWEEFDYAPFFARLRAAGYDKRISVEASTKDFASEAPQAIALLRRAFTATGGGPAPVAPSLPGPPAQGQAGPQRGTPPAPPAPPAPQTGRGSVGPRPNTGPADRPIIEPAALERGTKIYAVECVTCHGASARGTERGPSLIRSALVLSDRQGDVLGPFFAKGHPMQSGRPSSELTQAQAADLMQFIRQKYHDTLRGSPLFTVGDILTGDPDGRRGLLQRRGEVHDLPFTDGRPGGDRQALYDRRRSAAAHVVSVAGPRREPGPVDRDASSSRRLAASRCRARSWPKTTSSSPCVTARTRCASSAARPERRWSRPIRCASINCCSIGSRTKTSTTSWPIWRNRNETAARDGRGSRAGSDGAGRARHDRARPEQAAQARQRVADVQRRLFRPAVQRAWRRSRPRT